MKVSAPPIPEKLPFFIEHVKRTKAYNMVKYHSHDSYEIYYMRAGERIYFIKDRTYPVKPGDFVLIEPRALHRTTEAPQSPSHERILINFKRDFMAGMLEQLEMNPLSLFGVNTVLRLPPKEQTAAEAILGKMIKEQAQESPGYRGYLKLLLSELLIVLHRHASQDADKPHEYPNPMHRKMSEIAKYINEHYMEPLSLGALAERFHMSPYYLSRMYKEVTGFSYVEYVNQVRVQEAQTWLRTSRLNVTAITEKVGFENSTHFGRVFKDVTGMSPLKYRKMNE